MYYSRTVVHGEYVDTDSAVNNLSIIRTPSIPQIVEV